MKKLFPFISVLLLMVCSPSLQAQGGISYADALSRANSKRPVVLFCYGANYDKFSEKVYDEFVRKRKIMAAARQTVFVEMPFYQNPNEREKKDMERRLGKKRLPGGIWSVPCLAVIDAQGNLRGIVQTAEEMKDLKTASAALTRVLNDYRAQEDLIQKAAKAKDERKMDLMLQAADININMPPQEQKSSAQTAMGQRTTFDPLSLVEELQTMAPDVAYAHIRALMAQGGHSRAQRQEMLAAFGGHLRRNNASPDRLRAVYTEMRNIDPGSMYAAYAEGAIALWVERKPLDKSTVVTEVDYTKGDSETSSDDYSDEEE
ncbi:MAG: hypothetical protein IKK45_07620 [Akkermansia sp.]|nr:hypothetical protein [Akkermansia sp.]